MSKECLENLSGKEVYIVKHRDIYDSDYQEFIIGIGSTYDEAVNIIKDDLKNIPYAYSCYRYEIEKWQLDARYMGGLIQTFTREQNLELAKELGVDNE